MYYSTLQIAICDVLHLLYAITLLKNHTAFTQVVHKVQQSTRFEM